MTKKKLLIAAGVFLAVAVLLTAAVHTKPVEDQAKAIAASLN